MSWAYLIAGLFVAGTAFLLGVRFFAQRDERGRR